MLHHQYLLRNIIKKGRLHKTSVSTIDRIYHFDGGIHLEKEQKEKDVIRDEYLKSEGFTVLRIWNNVFLNKTEEFLKQIETIATSLSPNSSSSPLGSGRVREGVE